MGTANGRAWLAFAVLDLLGSGFSSHRALAQAPVQQSPPAKAEPPRLYIHLQDQRQSAAANLLRKRLKGKSVGGMPLSTVRPTIDARGAGVRTTQLRCGTAGDCALASELAALLGATLGTTPKIVDQSGTSSGGGANRPYHYEIWFAAGPIPIASTPANSPSSSPASTATGPSSSGTPGLSPTSSPSASPTSNPLSVATPSYLVTFAGDQRVPFTYVLQASDQVEEGDTIALAFRPPPGVDKSYLVWIDGKPAAAVAEPFGMRITVPSLPSEIFAHRTVPIRIVMGSDWQLDPPPTVQVSSLVSRFTVAIYIAVALAYAAALYWSYRWRLQMRQKREAEEKEEAARLTGLTESPAVDPQISSAFIPESEASFIAAQPGPDPLPQPAVRSGAIKFPEDLIDACVHAESLLFIGGEGENLRGVPSHASMMAQLLTETELDQHVRSQGTQVLASGDADTVIDLLAELMGRDALMGELERRSQAGDGGRWLGELANRIGFLGAISTLFPETVETAWPETIRLTPKSKYDFTALLRDRAPFVLRLRGDWAEKASVSLTSFEIGRALDESPSLSESLSAMFASRTALFVGLDAMTLGYALDTAGIRGASGRRHFALVQDGPSFEISASRFRRQYGIEFIRVYGAADLEAVLERLTEEVEIARNRTDDAVGVAAEQARVVHLKLRNIGPFAELDVDFRSQWTVLLGNNGAGKSTLLRAIALALSGSDNSVLEPGRPLLKRGEDKGFIEVTLDNGKSRSKYRSSLSLVQGRLSIRAPAAPLQSSTLAVFGFPAMRGLVAPGAIDFSRDDTFPHPRVADVLPIIAGGADDRGRSLRQWIFRVYLRSIDPHLSESERQKARAMIDGLFRVIDAMTPGFSLEFSRCDPDTSEILLKTTDGEMPMDYVSQGMASTIGWIGPVVQRLCEINGSAEDRYAILLIDEIDSHLHPAWQQKLVDSLKASFPNFQVIATTHSPLMVGNLGENEVMRVMRTAAGLDIEYLAQSFIGYRFDQILTDEAFGLPRARAEKWNVRERYIAIRSKPSRSPEEDAELARLQIEMRQLPGPAETPAERRAAAEAGQALDAAITAAGAQTQAEAASGPGETA